MIRMKTLGLAIGIAFAASSFALAQQGNPTNNQATQPASPTNTPAASGTPQGSPTNTPATSRTMHRTGTAANRQSISNQNRRLAARRLANRRLAARRLANRRLFAFQPQSRCRFVRVGNNLFRRICR
jgi:hypothetical protein